MKWQFAGWLASILFHHIGAIEISLID